MKTHLKSLQSSLVYTGMVVGMHLLAIIAAACLSSGQDVDEARSLMAMGDARLGSVNWDSDPPGIIEAKLVAANIDYENAYASVAGIPPGNEEEPDEAYAIRELIKSRITLISAALEIESALVHIMDAEDNARLYQYNLWYSDLAYARDDLRAAHGYLKGAVELLDAVSMARVPVGMQGDIAEAKVTCANLDGRVDRLESAIEGALFV